MIVIASIHQPSTSTLLLFDKVLLLSGGKTAYYGPPESSVDYFVSKGHKLPPMRSPAEFMLELTNFDFMRDQNRSERLANLVELWNSSFERKQLENDVLMSRRIDEQLSITDGSNGSPPNLMMQTLILLHRMALVRPKNTIF